ncbi:uncharacterized protein ARMOST_14113 [Armillaria ostoyae]|uniref:Uncharacterized protein n=1 Tax=Armillaria ostoyae TaxID=47428 RepID=A0A284RPP5_ARMOS|nr:uncharacterized protein ARMOST_14113 [Armillaria ostoyae]
MPAWFELDIFASDIPSQRPTFLYYLSTHLCLIVPACFTATTTLAVPERFIKISGTYLLSSTYTRYEKEASFAPYLDVSYLRGCHYYREADKQAAREGNAKAAIIKSISKASVSFERTLNPLGFIGPPSVL